jgi:hypothetical protein
MSRPSFWLVYGFDEPRNRWDRDCSRVTGYLEAIEQVEEQGY